MGIVLVLPDPELLAIFRLVVSGVLPGSVGGGDVDDFAAEVDVAGLPVGLRGFYMLVIVVWFGLKGGGTGGKRGGQSYRLRCSS